jgi:DNA polymerase I-like protein with 3'-5' exonuclease and polymerase domains
VAEKLAILDFETYKIEPRPAYPPKPVGLAWLVDGKKGYLACRSPSEKMKCGKYIKQLVRSGYRLVFHHASFDLDVAETHLGVSWPATHHDTLILAYLFEPRANTFALKPLAEKLLGEKPDERDRLRDWIVANVTGATEKTWGAFISEAPFELVRPYAIGDVTRTGRLLKHFLGQLKDEPKMVGAYERELKLSRVLVKMERRGVPVAVKALTRDMAAWKIQQLKLETSLMKTLKVPKRSQDEFVWAGKNFAQQLVTSGIVKKLPLTAKGNPSTSADNLGPLVPKKIGDALELRAQLQTCIKTFAEAWLAQARDGGRFFASYNQVRQDSRDGRAMVGTTTGRLSMSPNLQNVIRSDKGDLVPQLRGYLVPLSGWWWLKRDYCFSSDTEVLTEQGWVLFKDLDRTEKLAQWRAGEISFAKPLSYQVVPFKGDLVNIIGVRSTDLLVSPEHNCLQVFEDRGVGFTKAIDYVFGKTQQLHAGDLDQGAPVSLSEVSLAVAIQADAKVEIAKSGEWRIIFLLKKQRKVDRLVAVLNDLQIKFSTSFPPSKEDFTCIRFKPDRPLPEILSLFVKDGKINKHFVLKELLKIDTTGRQFFLKELGYWDGTIKGKHGWSYGTLTQDNADMVQAVAAVSDCRSTMKMTVLKSGKPFYVVGMTLRTNRTWTKLYEKTMVPYDGAIYCVTMPWSTVVVRRNGKVMVTGQSQQEFRIFAHYEEGELLARYKINPKMDAHVVTGIILKEKAGIILERRATKDINFGTIYGMGIAKMAKKLGLDDVTARRTLKAYHQALPGIKQLQKQLTACADAGEPIYTWGGRRYYCELPQMVMKVPYGGGAKRLTEQTYEYKLLNLLVQGSAADATKEAILRYDATGWNEDDRGPLLLQVHDELDAMAPAKLRQQAMKALRETMESIEIDIPLLSDGSASRTSWNEVEDVNW